MKKSDEIALMYLVLHGATVRLAAKTLEMHPKRLHYILLKWAHKGWWDYGVSPEAGWLEPEGRAALAKMFACLPLSQ